MPKSRKGNIGINIKAEKVGIHGDAVAGNKTVYQSSTTDIYSKAEYLMKEVENQINNLEQVPNQQKIELIKTAEDIKTHLHSENPDAKTILDKLGNFQKLLATISGIGTAGLGIYTLIENIVKLIPK